MTPGPAQSLDDGRVVRGLRNREALVEAIITLNEEGVLRPSAAEIAERAGVSLRSVYRHFEDMAGLHEAAAERQLERIAPLIVEVPPEGPLAARIEAFVDHRARLLETNIPVRRAADLREPFFPELRRVLDGGRRMLRDQVETTFAPEIDALRGADRDAARRAADLAASYEAWEFLRVYQGASFDEASAVMARLLRAALAAD